MPGATLPHKRFLVTATLFSVSLLAQGLPLAEVCAPARAGIVSDIGNALNSLLSEVGNSGVLQVGDALNTGQMQQLTAQEKLDNQSLQEKALSKNQIALSGTVSRYQAQTSSVNQLPGVPCQQQAMAKAAQQANTGASAQGQAIALSALGQLHPGGAVFSGGGSQLPPTTLQTVQNVAAATSSDVNANSLYHASGAQNAPVTANLLINPVSVQPLTQAQANTPAGQQFIAFYNANAAVLTVAAQALGKVGGLHAITLPASAVAATAQAISASPSIMSSAAPTVSASTQAPPPAASDNNPQPARATGAWTSLVPTYANQVAAVAAKDNIPAAWIAATIAHEDGPESLTAMPCGSVSSATPYLSKSSGFTSVWCPAEDSSAKSLGQITDPTWAGLAPGTSPMLGTQSVTDELNAMGVGAKEVLSICHGNAACAFAKWNQGAGFPYAPGADAAYVDRSMSLYTGKAVVPVGQYNGPSQGGGSSDSSSGGASDTQLLRLISYATYANPAWYAQLASTGTTGALRTAAFLNAQDLELQNQRRRLLEEVDMIQAARLSLEMRSSTAHLNQVRGQAMSEYAAEGPWTKFWNWASNTL